MCIDFSCFVIFLWMISINFDWLSFPFIDSRPFYWLPCLFTNFMCLSSTLLPMFIDFSRFSVLVLDFHRFPMIFYFLDFMNLIDFCWCSLIFVDSRRSPWTFKGRQAGGKRNICPHHKHLNFGRYCIPGRVVEGPRSGLLRASRPSWVPGKPLINVRWFIKGLGIAREDIRGSNSEGRNSTRKIRTPKRDMIVL